MFAARWAYTAVVDAQRREGASIHSLLAQVAGRA